MEQSNEPTPMSGGPGMSGPRRVVTAKEARERRAALTDLMSNGLLEDEIFQAMLDKFQMSQQEVVKLRDKCRANMLAEYDDSSALHKAMASRRIHRHIVQASKARQWGAVANLESQLGKVQGTESPMEANITIDARLQQATMQVLGTLTPGQVQELVAEELKRLPVTSPPSQVPSEPEKT